VPSGALGPAFEAPAPTIKPLSVSVRQIVSATATAPITVTTGVPAGADVLSIRVFQLSAAPVAAAAVFAASPGKLIASLYRNTPNAKQYKVRLTGPKLKHPKRGSYRVEVRVGKSRPQLGPVTARVVTVR
jgi:hypothetical protein